MSQVNPQAAQDEEHQNRAPVPAPVKTSGLSPKTVTTFAVLALVLAQILVAVFLFMPMAKGAAESRKEIAAEQTTQATLQQQITAAEAQTNQLDTLKATLEQLKQQIPGSLDQEGFLRTVNDIVDSNHVKLNSINWKDPITFEDFTTIVSAYPIQPDNVEADQQLVYDEVNAALEAAASDTDLRAVPVNITVSGDYDEMGGFIKSAQTLDRIYWVNGINISQSSGSGEEAGDYTAVLTGYTFIRVEV